MIGVVLLAHEQPRRTAQLARFMAQQGCKVAIHVDARASESQRNALKRILGDTSGILHVRSRRCDWGTFSLVEAALDGVRMLLNRWPDISHVCQLSGACLPIKPIPALEAHLNAHADVDFIESVPVEDDPWVVDGLSAERFTLYHPLPWRRFRRTFDRLVKVQRTLRIRRKLPEGLQPRLGSQWWCLSRKTLDAILADPQFPEYCRYFKSTWIPDESFFQTLAAKHSDRVTSVPLTFVRFDPQGKPYVFYDDHLDLLLHADGFFARKIWRGANQLYATFLSPDLDGKLPRSCDGGRLLRRFDRARRLHQTGRPGLISQGRHPGRRMDRQFETARPYVVIDGLDRVLPDLLHDLNQQPGVIAHGQLFHPDRVEFVGGAQVFTGNLSAEPRIRDHKQAHFLSKLVWIERRQTQCFLHHFHHQPTISTFILGDPNARVLRLADAWLFDLFRSWTDRPEDLRDQLARLKERAAAVDDLIANSDPRAAIRTVSLIDMLQRGSEIADELAAHSPQSIRQPSFFSALRLPENFGRFLSDLSDVESAPSETNHLSAEVEHYEDMIRVLRRKT